MRIFDNIPVPAPARAGRPGGNDFGVLGTGQATFIDIASGVEPAKMLDRVKGQVARWRKADESRKNHKFTVALAPIPGDPMGTTAVGVWRTA